MTISNMPTIQYGCQYVSIEHNDKIRKKPENMVKIGIITPMEEPIPWKTVLH